MAAVCRLRCAAVNFLHHQHHHRQLHAAAAAAKILRFAVAAAEHAVYRDCVGCYDARNLGGGVV